MVCAFRVSKDKQCKFSYTYLHSLPNSYSSLENKDWAPIVRFTLGTFIFSAPSSPLDANLTRWAGSYVFSLQNACHVLTRARWQHSSHGGDIPDSEAVVASPVDTQEVTAFKLAFIIAWAELGLNSHGSHSSLDDCSGKGP